MSSPLLVIKTKGDKQMKKVGTCYYVHKSNIRELLEIMDNQLRGTVFLQFLAMITVVDHFQFLEMEGFKYEVIKYDSERKSISFINSPDWDTANEPEVGDAWMFSINDNFDHWKFIKARKKNKQIYHAKYLFVADDYKGFDIEQARQRAIQWQKLPGIKEVKNKIGNKDFWVEFLHKNGMEV